MSGIMRKRVVDAINHKETDLTPWDIELTSAFEKKFMDETGCGNVAEYLGCHNIKFRYKQNKVLDGGREEDIFGATWEKTKDGGDVGNIVGYPLLNNSEDDILGSYNFPEIRVGFANSQCDKLEADKEHFRMFGITMCYFERAWSLRTMEELLADMAINQSETHKLFDGILEHHLKLLDIILERDFEAVYFGDDWGQQRGLIMGPKYWREYIKPGFKAMFEKVKNKGKYVVLHSCGDLSEIMGEVIDIGMDVYNTVQPEIYDLKKLKEEYGKHMTIYGGISTQQFLPHASVSECREQAKWMIENMGRGGGLILSPTHAVTPDIPAENIIALADTAREMGKQKIYIK